MGLARLIPWWLFFILAAGLGFLTFETYRDYTRDQGNLEAAIAVEPEPIALRDLPNAVLESPLGEFAITDFGGLSVGTVDTGRRGRSGRSFLILESFSNPTVMVAFTEAALLDDVLQEEAARIEADWENSVVRGLLTDSTLYRSDLIDLMRDEGIWVEGTTLLMAEQLRGERVAALTEHVESGQSLAMFMGGATLVLVLIGAFKFRRWRGRAAVAA